MCLGGFAFATIFKYRNAHAHAHTIEVVANLIHMAVTEAEFGQVLHFAYAHLLVARIYFAAYLKQFGVDGFHFLEIVGKSAECLMRIIGKSPYAFESNVAVECLQLFDFCFEQSLVAGNALRHTQSLYFQFVGVENAYFAVFKPLHALGVERVEVGEDALLKCNAAIEADDFEA